MLLHSGGGAEYCDRFVCLSVHLSVSEHISGTAGPIFAKFLMWIPCGCGSVPLWRRCDTLCTSGFMDDVTFGRKGPYGKTWRLHYREATTTSTSGVAIPGWCLMSMNACKFCGALLYAGPGSCRIGPICVLAVFNPTQFKLSAAFHLK